MSQLSAPAKKYSRSLSLDVIVLSTAHGYIKTKINVLGLQQTDVVFIASLCWLEFTFFRL